MTEETLAGTARDAPVAPPLTAAVIAPGWALAYAVAVLALNLALQFGSRSAVVLGALRSLALGLSGSDDASRAFASASLSATIMVASYGLTLLPAVALAVTARRRGVTLASAVGLRATGVGRALRLSALVVLWGGVVTVLYAATASALGLTVQGNTAALVTGFGAGRAEMVLAFLLVGVVGPFVEEVTFRGIMFPSLQASWGTWPAMIVTGAIFGIVHLQLSIAVPIALLGMALAAVFVRTRSLWAAYAAHCAYNIVSLAIAFALLR